jgi:hypothetical protein
VTEIIIHFQTDQPEIESGFFDNLYTLANQYGIRVKRDCPSDSGIMIQEDRNMLEQRTDERVSQSKGLQKDLSHLKRLKG